MKKVFTRMALLLLFVSPFARAQESSGGSPFSFIYQLGDENLPLVQTPVLDAPAALAAAEADEKNGKPYKNGATFPLSVSPQQMGTWINLPDGDRLWKIKIKSPGALGMYLYFSGFSIPEGARLFVYNEDRTQVYGAYTSENNKASGVFVSDATSGDVQVVEYYEPAAAAGLGRFTISEAAHLFRMEGYSLSPLADPCEVDVNCSEGANWQDQKKGVVRIQVKIGSNLYLCTGSLVNNTALDCRKYILTAAHCTWASTTTQASTSDLTQWVFWFGRERANCASGSIPTNLSMTGCTKVADASTGMNTLGSDFYLVELTSANFPTNYSTPYFNGWTKSSTAPSGGGVGIHHPAGSEKKISTFTATPTSTTWSGSPTNAHWTFSWVQTTNGWGVTEGGSSGSPAFNSAGLIFGTLTGGASYCNSVVSGANDDPDMYGKMSYHWSSNSTSSNKQLKPWLDPINSGVTTLTGTFPPCTTTGVNEANLNNLVTVYPNPSNGFFNVEVGGSKSLDLQVEVLDITGRIVAAYGMSSGYGKNFSLDLSNEPNGIYLLKLSRENSVYVKKLIVNR